MQDLPPIFSPHLFAFNSAPQGHHMIVSNGASLPEPAQRAHQLPTDSSCKDNPPVCEDTATARCAQWACLEFLFLLQIDCLPVWTLMPCQDLPTAESCDFTLQHANCKPVAVAWLA